MLHGLPAASGLTLLAYAVCTLPVPPMATLAMALFLLAAAGGAVMSLAYKWRLLWQVALAGDRSCTRLHAEHEGVQALVDKLLRWYPPGHEVILYEAARLPIETPRTDRLPLRDLPAAHYEKSTTLVIRPLGELRDDLARALGA